MHTHEMGGFGSKSRWSSTLVFRPDETLNLDGQLLDQVQIKISGSAGDSSIHGLLKLG